MSDTGDKSVEIEGRVTALEVGQQAIQEDIRELTSVVTDLAHETRRSLSVIQKPNWQYIAVLLALVIAIGNFYIRDQQRIDGRITGTEASFEALDSGRVSTAYSTGKHDAELAMIKERVNSIEERFRDHETLRGHQGVIESVSGLKESINDLQARIAK